MSDRLDQTLQDAIEVGLLPAQARRPDGDGRPGSVVLLTALGAWLAAVPLLGAVALLLGDVLYRGLGPYLIGALVLAGAVVTLRSRGVPLFVEQLAVPGLLVGIGSLGFGVFRDLPTDLGAGVLSLVALGLAGLLPRVWLRVLLGAAAVGLAVVALVQGASPRHGPWTATAWLALHLALGVWVLGLWVQQTVPGLGRGRLAATIEATGAGWFLGVVAGLALSSGMTFLVGAQLDPLAGALVHALVPGAAAAPWVRAGSVALVLVATLWGALTWSGLRRPWVLGVGLAVAGLACFLPNLGGVWLGMVLTATTWRWRLAASAGLAGAWIIGAFYYQLQWPLATKALILVGAGALLGALAWWGGRASSVGAPSAVPTQRRALSPWAIALALVATLGVVNLGIWRNEGLIALGQTLYVELAPLDPRSLMQGDYMRLNFRVPAEVQRALGPPGTSSRLAVARRDGRGVATLLRPAGAHEALAQGELLVELTPKAGRWMLASDAWYFQEGDAQRWEPARYGEFRVLPNGRALLVGLADADLRPLGR